jgi:hypothetical protein
MILVTMDEVLLVIGVIEFLQLVTTRKNYALTVPHTSQITIVHTRSVKIFTSRCLVAVAYTLLLFTDRCLVMVVI